MTPTTNRHAVSLLLCAAATALILPPAGRAASPPPRNRLLVGPRMGFNIRADFRPQGSGVNPGPGTGGAVNRTYEDGFMGVDRSGNAGNQSWYWGYQNDSQVDPAADALSMHADLGDRPTFSDVTDNPQVGVEALYQRLLGEFGGAGWGLETGAAWMPVDIANSHGFAANWTRLTDAYSLGGILPPAAPYTGSVDGPGPAIGSEPTRNTVAQSVIVHGREHVDSQVFGIRLGPVLDVPMGAPLSLQLSGGLLVTYLHTEFSYREQVQYADGSTGGGGGSTIENDWLVGGYARGQIIVHVSRNVGFYGAAEFQALPEVDYYAGPWKTTLDMGSTVYGSAGVVVQF
jgi:hypothetical protein